MFIRVLVKSLSGLLLFFWKESIFEEFKKQRLINSSLKGFYGINNFFENAEKIHFFLWDMIDCFWSIKTRHSNSVYRQWTVTCLFLPLFKIIFETQQSRRDSYKRTICCNWNCISSHQNKNCNVMYFLSKIVFVIS